MTQFLGKHRGGLAYLRYVGLTLSYGYILGLVQGTIGTHLPGYVNLANSVYREGMYVWKIINLYPILCFHNTYLSIYPDTLPPPREMVLKTNKAK